VWCVGGVPFDPMSGRPANEASRREHRDGSTLDDRCARKQQLNQHAGRKAGLKTAYMARLIEKITRPSAFWSVVKALATIGSPEPIDVPT
jgi:hypothetical protein